MIPARRRWGQHFLASAQIGERIAEAASLRPTDTVIEVGPGEGALTRPLAARAARVLAIEIDPPRARALAQEFSGREGIRILAGDVLERSFGEWLEEAGWRGPAVLIANLPYNVATPILTAAIGEPRAISRTIATVQREVASRLAAQPGQEGYGYLSVRSAAFARARILFDLAPSAFRPRPKVTSTVVALEPRVPALDAAVRDRALVLASLGFRLRRKKLANALAPAGARADWERALAAIGKNANARAEELSLEDYLKLAEVPCEPGDPTAYRASGIGQ